jgi:hypothetical protein
MVMPVLLVTTAGASNEKIFPFDPGDGVISMDADPIDAGITVGAGE